MRYLKYVLSIVALLILGMYGWYLLATALNEHSDVAATAIIEDTLSSNAAYDIKQLRGLASRLRDNDIDGSIELVQEMIEDKTWQLEYCVSEQCKKLQKIRSAQ